MNVDTGRDMQGRFGKGNTAALITGSRSAAFWEAAEAERQRIRTDTLSAMNVPTSEATAPELAIADGLAQSVLVRDSAFLKLQGDGGPVTTKGRARKAVDVWQTASQSAMRHAQVARGMRRERTFHADTLDAHLRRQQEQGQ